MMRWKDTRKPIAPHGIVTVADASSFEHTATACPCEPWTLTVNPSGAAITLVMHRPVTQRGNVTRRRLFGRKHQQELAKEEA